MSAEVLRCDRRRSCIIASHFLKVSGAHNSRHPHKHPHSAMLTNTLRSPQPWSRELFQCICSPNCCRRGSRTISTNSAIARALRETSAAERRYPGNKARPLFRKELAAFDRKIDESRMKERYNKRVKRERKREVASEEPENKRELSLEEAITLEETMVRGNTGWYGSSCRRWVPRY